MISGNTSISLYRIKKPHFHNAVFFMPQQQYLLVYMYSVLNFATQFVGDIEHIYFAGQDIESKKCLGGKPA